MNKLMALVLSLGLVLLGTAPVMAAGQQTKVTPTNQQERVVQVVVPKGQELEKSDLDVLVGQKTMRTFQDVVEFVGKVALAVGTLGDDWSGNVFDDAVGISAGLSAGIDVIDTAYCYILGRCN